MLQLCTIYACVNGTLGLNLSRAPWDPYPWVSGVQADSRAQQGGVCIGDTLLELNGCDVLGLRISELATRLHEHWQSGAEFVTMMMWRQQTEIGTLTDATDAEDEQQQHHQQHGINQQSLQKFATCLQHIAQLLECPVCLEVIKPPGWQCCNGHVLCNNCRSRSVKCPVCRVPLGPRGRCLLSDKLFTLLAENFPCDGVKTNKMHSANATDQKDNKNKLTSGGGHTVNKCTNDYHNQPKMALAKSNLGKQTLQPQKKCNNKILRQEQLQLQEQQEQQQQQQQLGEVLLVVTEEGQQQSKELANGECSMQIPKGNEQNNANSNSHRDRKQHKNSRISSSSSSSGRSQSSCDDAQACTMGDEQQQQQQQQQQRRQTCLAKMLSSVTARRCSMQGAGTDSGNSSSSSNNMLVKPKLKLGKKSCQITSASQDQDELHSDEVANINIVQLQ